MLAFVFGCECVHMDVGVGVDVGVDVGVGVVTSVSRKNIYFKLFQDIVLQKC